MSASIPRECAVAGVAAGREIRRRVHALPLAERARMLPSPLKPRLRELTRAVDRVGDAVVLEHLEVLAHRLRVRIDLVLDPGTGDVVSLAPAGGGGARVVFAYADAVDGTIKVGGLGNDTARGIVRAACDGGWAAALAFTAPTRASLDQLRIGDFVAAAVVDGNPTRWATYPQEVLAHPDDAGRPGTWDVTAAVPPAAAPPPARRVWTSSSTVLAQTMAYLDSFQAFDRETRADGDEALCAELYRGLVNRLDGGAFDVLRQYANLNALQRTMLGWRDPPTWCEPQGGAFLVVNENLCNLVPAVPVIAGAGGTSCDFDGRPLAQRRLIDGRTSLVHLAGDGLRAPVLALIAAARARAGAAPA